MPHPHLNTKMKMTKIWKIIWWLLKLIAIQSDARCSHRMPDFYLNTKMKMSKIWDIIWWLLKLIVIQSCM